MNDAEKLKAVHGAQMDNFCDTLQKSFQDTVDGLTMKNLRDAAAGLIKKEDSSDSSEKQQSEQEDSYDTGVITLYGLNSVTFKVQDSSIIMIRISS